MNNPEAEDVPLWPDEPRVSMRALRHPPLQHRDDAPGVGPSTREIIGSTHLTKPSKIILSVRWLLRRR